jgi:DNA-binding NarL/FixJ family response regulator
MSTQRITLVIADDHTVVRQGFRRLLEFEPDFEVLGEAQEGRDAVQMVRRLRPSVVLMDIAMPRLNGLEATRQILAEDPAARIVMLSAHSDDAYVDGAIKAGAVGFLQKQTSAEQLYLAIRSVVQGKSYFCPSVSRRLDRLNPQFPIRKGPLKHKPVLLTPREMEVLQLIAEGKANKETAVELGIGMKTVEKHRDHLMKKLDIHDTAGLTRYAIAAGIIESCIQVTTDAIASPTVAASEAAASW